MSNVLILGASGNIGKLVADELADSDHKVRLFVRSSNKIDAPINQEVFEGDAHNERDLYRAMEGIDIVFSNLGPRGMKSFATAVVSAMKQRDIRRLLWTATAGIYKEFSTLIGVKNYVALGGPPDLKGSYLYDQRQGADYVENSGLDYTIFRWNWLTFDNIVTDVVITEKGQQYEGKPISRKTTAVFVKKVIDHPELYIGHSLGIAAK